MEAVLTEALPSAVFGLTVQVKRAQVWTNPLLAF